MKALKSGEPFRPHMLLDGALIPAAILKDPALSAGARLPWVILAEYQARVWSAFRSKRCWQSLGVKSRQLRTYLKELENYTRGDPPEPFPLIEAKRWSVGGHRLADKDDGAYVPTHAVRFDTCSQLI